MKEWLVRKLKSDKTVLVLAFLIPFAIMVGVCISHGIYPFGNQCFLHVDMYHQYCPFTAEFWTKLREHTSLAYSWNIGLGSDFIAQYAYYLASPMNWLLVLCPQQFVIEFMTFLILIKIGLSGFSFAYYLRKHFQTKSYSVILFAIFYALSGFTCAYNWNIMWLDGIWLFPLIVLGLERLVKEKKGGLYYVTLAVSIFSNYYISIMICIFLVLYYFILMLEQPLKKFIPTSLRFGGYSLLAGGTSAILLLPEINALSYSGSGSTSFPTTVEWYFDILSGLARSCINVEAIVTTDHWPNIYCGCAVLVLLFLYLLNKKIPLKRKIPRLLLLAFIMVSFSNNVLTFIWHGLDFPDGLPARQAYVYIFLLLLLCFETVYYAKGSRPIHIGISLLLGMSLLVLFALFTDTSLVTMTSIALTGGLLGAYALIYLFFIGRNVSLRRLGCMFAFVLVIVEATVNLENTSVITTNRNTYTQNLYKYETLTENVKAKDDSFYRIDKYNRLTKNESSLTGYQSASVFSTFLNIKVADFYRKLGMEGGKNYYCYNGATPLTSAILSVKYLMTDSAYEESPVRTLVDSIDGMYLYENKYTLPLGFVVDTDLEERWDYEWGTSISVQNQLARELRAEEDLFTPLFTDVQSGETIITVEEDSYIYAYYTDKSAKDIKADFGFKTRSFSKCDHVYLLDLGWCEAGTTIRLTSTDTDILQLQAYQMNLEVLDTAFDKLNESTMEIEIMKDTLICGHIDLENDGNLVLSIPAEDGWQIKVDGEVVETETFCDAFFSVPLTAGYHEIELQYKSPGLGQGALISLACLLVFGGIMVVKNRSKFRGK